MKYKIVVIILFISFSGFSQDTIQPFKKRVLEKTEVDILGSYYSQTGNNAAVTGGIGTEKLSNPAGAIKILIPLNSDDVLRVEGGVSVYTSASSGNLNPFDLGRDKDEKSPLNPEGSPWVESSGASRQDALSTGSVGYSHANDNRTTTWDGNVSFASEYDYTSVGFGGGFSKLFNEDNTSLSLKGNIFIDNWSPESPIELVKYIQNGNSTSGFFQNFDILDASGNPVNSGGTNYWKPKNNTLLSTTSRNSYSVSLGFSQIVSKNAQFSVNVDLVSQNGWLANPMQRVYFKDVDNYFVGNKNSIPDYATANNADVFQLADDIERLPSNRTKLPIGVRFNYYLNEMFVAKSFFRYYADNWGVRSQTFQFDLPIKIKSKITLYPTFRYYSQSQADYFAGYEEHLSTEEFYTSDYDLSEYSATQYGFGVKYKDIFADNRIGNFGLKSATLRYTYYQRSTGLNANIVTFSLGFLIDKFQLKKK